MSYRGFPKVIVPVSMIAFVTVFGFYMLFGHDIPFWHHLKPDFPPVDVSTVVRIVGQQFAWNIHYPGEDGIFGKTDPYLVDEQANPLGLDSDDPAALNDITTVGQLHVPVNKPVIIHTHNKRCDSQFCFAHNAG